jgi:hypothetical protein
MNWHQSLWKMADAAEKKLEVREFNADELMTSRLFS